MRYEWDEAKRQANLKKHRMDFVEAKDVFAGAVFTFEDERFDYSEQRFITIGLLRGTCVVIAHTERGSVTRIISMRKASKYEESLYYQSFTD